MRTLTAGQTTNVTAASTRPIFIVDINHSGTTEYLSCSGAITYGGQAYTAGGINITQIVDSDVASLTMEATATRIGEVQDNSWRGGTCIIRAIPGAPADSGTYTASPDQAIVILDGIIQTSKWSGERITVTAKCKYFDGTMVPRLRLDQVAHHIPPVGTLSTWDSETYDYAQWKATTAAIQKVTRPGVVPTVKGRESATQINEKTDPNQQTGQALISGEGVTLPLVYGRAAVNGFVFADGTFGGAKIIGVAWCLGEVYQIEKVYVNDTDIDTLNITARHYRGTSTQGVDGALEDFIADYNDDMIYHFGGGDVGVCYSVLGIDPSVLGDSPRFRAVIKGRLVDDPTASPQSSDPYSDLVALSVDFTVSTTDTSSYAHTVSLNGGAAIGSPQSLGLVLDGTGDYASITPQSPNVLNPGASDFTLEIEANTSTATDSPEPVETLFTNSATGSPATRSIQIDRIGTTFYLYLSSDGQVWDLANGIDAGSLSASPLTSDFRFVLEKVGNRFRTYIDGVPTQVINPANSSPTFSPEQNDPFQTGADWRIGAANASPEQAWTGAIKSIRMTIGVARYGGNHSTANSPFSDSGTYGTKVYSTNPALAWSDLASDPYTGLGATTTNVAAAAAWCDDFMTGGSPQVERAKIGLAITTNATVTDWLTTLATYGNCIWHPEGSDLRIKEDAPVTYYSPDPTYSLTEWVEGSMTMEGVATENSPNMITVTYTVPSDTSGAWETKSYTVASSEAADE